MVVTPVFDGQKTGLAIDGEDARHALAAWPPVGMGGPPAAWRDQAARAATAGWEGTIPLSLYPDYDRRSRNRTGSADLAAMPGKPALQQALAD